MRSVKAYTSFYLIQLYLKISALTQGSFDFTYGSIDKRFWNFDAAMTSLPDKTIAKRSVRLINFRNVILNENDSTVLLKEKGMRIGFGGIGKGYAADRSKYILQQMGVENGVINAAGDLVHGEYRLTDNHGRLVLPIRMHDNIHFHI